MPVFKSHGFQVGGERGQVGVSRTSAIWELASGLRSSGPGRWEETAPERVSLLASVTRRFGSLGTTTVAPCSLTPLLCPDLYPWRLKAQLMELPLQGPAHFSYALTFPWGFLARRDPPTHTPLAHQDSPSCSLDRSPLLPP